MARRNVFGILLSRKNDDNDDDARRSTQPAATRREGMTTFQLTERCAPAGMYRRRQHTGQTATTARANCAFAQLFRIGRSQRMQDDCERAHSVAWQKGDENGGQRREKAYC